MRAWLGVVALLPVAATALADGAGPVACGTCGGPVNGCSCYRRPAGDAWGGGSPGDGGAAKRAAEARRQAEEARQAALERARRLAELRRSAEEARQREVLLEALRASGARIARQEALERAAAALVRLRRDEAGAVWALAEVGDAEGAAPTPGRLGAGLEVARDALRLERLLERRGDSLVRVRVPPPSSVHVERSAATSGAWDQAPVPLLRATRDTLAPLAAPLQVLRAPLQDSLGQGASTWLGLRVRGYSLLATIRDADLLAGEQLDARRRLTRLVFDGMWEGARASADPDERGAVADAYEAARAAHFAGEEERTTADARRSLLQGFGVWFEGKR